MDIATLGIKVESSQVRAAAADFDRFAQAGKRAETGAKSVERSAATAARAATLLRNAFAGISVGLIVREYIRLSDQFSTLNARLRLVAGSADEYRRAQSALFDIANRTRTDLQSTVELFGSLARSTEALGVSQEDVLKVTETINQALQVSGANAQSAAAALVQLGQGFASGTLRGEELNSVLEQAPRLAQAIADGLGVPLGKLRELGQQGKLTAQEVFRALQGSAARIAQEYARLPLTVGGATTQVRNSVLELIGAFDQASGASGGLASLISDLSGWIRDLAAEVRRLQADGSIARWADDARAAIEDVVDGAAVLGASLELLNKFAIAAGTVQRNSALWLFSADARREIEQSKTDFQQALADMQRAYQKFQTRETQPTAQKDEDFLPKPKRPTGTSGGGTGRVRASETERYLEQLRRQIGGVYELTAAEQLEYDIREGLLKLDGKISRERLLSVANELDAIRQRRDAEKDAAREVIEAIEEEQRARKKRISDAQRETVDLGSGNEELRREIELIGANARAKQAIEQARISSAIAIKTEALATADLNALSDEERRALTDQIKLLRERLVLLGEKGLKDALQEDLEAQREFVKNAAENIQRYLGDSLYDIMSGNFKNIADSFTQMVNRMVAEAIAADLSKYLLGDLVKGGNGKGVVGALLEKVFGSALSASGPSTAGQLNMMTYMADGGIVDRPTMFGYGGNRTGVMGEAGPEGILPLRRDSQGRLGVMAAGAQAQPISVQMTVVTPDAESFRRSEGQITSRLSGALSRSRRYA